MRIRPNPAEALLKLPELTDSESRRANWRQAVAALGQQRIGSPPPLEAVDQADLVRSTRVLLDSGLADDLDWIGAGAAGVALYELMVTLPAGRERREIGRRVFSRLYGGPAGAFVSVATRMAWSSTKQLLSATMRARVGLCFSLPLGGSVNTGPLALALLNRRPHFEYWVVNASTGPLPSRRLAAQLYQQAAREAVRRSQNGDHHSVELMLGPVGRPWLDRLLADREPLVWKHAAAARGLLSAADSRVREEIEAQLDPSLGPSQWRRGVVSLVACLGYDPRHALPQCRKLLKGELQNLHPSLLETFVWGLEAVTETEPEIAEGFLLELAAIERPQVGREIAQLLREVHNPAFGASAAERLWATLDRLESSGDRNTRLQVEQIRRRLDPGSDTETIFFALRRAMVAYETSGAATAHELAADALHRATQVMHELEGTPTSAAGLVAAMPLLQDLDASALERSRLYDLLLLGRRPGDPDASVPMLESLYERLGTWLTLGEAQQEAPGSWNATGLKARKQKLITFLHLLDVQSTQNATQDVLAERVRLRIGNAMRALLVAVRRHPEPAVHRVTCAALARSLDAAVREEVADISDLLLLVIEHLSDVSELEAVWEASTDSDMREALQGYAEFLKSTVDAERAPERTRGAQCSSAFVDLSRGLGRRGSYRGEALRQAFLRIGRCLEAVNTARGLLDVTRDQPGAVAVLEDLEEQLEAIQQLAGGASRRVLSSFPDASKMSAGSVSPPLAEVVETCCRANERLAPEVLHRAFLRSSHRIPRPLTEPIRLVLEHLVDLPVRAPDNVSVKPVKPREKALPDWLLPRRTIGGFYVVRALGAGGVSSVFVARRIEDRHKHEVEEFALKVPEYDPNTARSISEQAFLELFRDEAGALLSLPRNEHLARFVNFDMAAKPKPILVMELIRGDSLDKLIRSRSLSIRDAVAYLEGILMGLHAMHRAGVAHLDVKPSNVILRNASVPVLVDFGLSGRQLRPGCGTPEYCAPEVLGVVPKDYTPEPCATDMYAFACTAVEALTGQLLFSAHEETALMAQHISHDGWPPSLAAFSELPGLRTLAVILAACLRRDQRARPTAAETLAELQRCSQELPYEQLVWPLPLHGSKLGRAV